MRPRLHDHCIHAYLRTQHKKHMRVHSHHCIHRVGQSRIYTPCIWWNPCPKYRIYTVYIWFWPTLCIHHSHHCIHAYAPNIKNTCACIQTRHHNMHAYAPNIKSTCACIQAHPHNMHAYAADTSMNCAVAGHGCVHSHRSVRSHPYRHTGTQRTRLRQAQHSQAHSTHRHAQARTKHTLASPTTQTMAT